MKFWIWGLLLYFAIGEVTVFLRIWFYQKTQEAREAKHIRDAYLEKKIKRPIEKIWICVQGMAVAIGLQVTLGALLWPFQIHEILLNINEIQER